MDPMPDHFSVVVFDISIYSMLYNLTIWNTHMLHLAKQFFQ